MCEMVPVIADWWQSTIARAQRTERRGHRWVHAGIPRDPEPFRQKNHSTMEQGASSRRTLTHHSAQSLFAHLGDLRVPAGAKRPVGIGDEIDIAHFDAGFAKAVLDC